MTMYVVIPLNQGPFRKKSPTKPASGIKVRDGRPIIIWKNCIKAPNVSQITLLKTNVEPNNVDLEDVPPFPKRVIFFRVYDGLCQFCGVLSNIFNLQIKPFCQNLKSQVFRPHRKPRTIINMCQGLSTPYIGDKLIPPLVGICRNPYNRYINPYNLRLMTIPYGNNGCLDGTYEAKRLLTPCQGVFWLSEFHLPISFWQIWLPVPLCPISGTPSKLDHWMRHVLKPKQEAAKVIRRMFWTTSMGSLNLPTQHIVICGFPSLKMTRPHQDHQVGFLPQKIGFSWFSFKDPWFPVGTMAGGCFSERTQNSFVGPTCC